MNLQKFFKVYSIYDVREPLQEKILARENGEIIPIHFKKIPSTYAELSSASLTFIIGTPVEYLACECEHKWCYICRASLGIDAEIHNVIKHWF